MPISIEDSKKVIKEGSYEALFVETKTFRSFEMRRKLSRDDLRIIQALSRAKGKVPLREARKIMEIAGCKLDRIVGSHHIFTKPGQPKIFTWPVHKNKVKARYVREAIKILFKEL